ncbi:hypothetical protein CEXT_456751 [Caerostris extrusa]|uniref:Uncharacterized protein n=1 Tax=Caerostris extrusa TaxID=172846 RepID=A0AAV4UKZ1_CAEEX|nr:hypothetical protein CEXT_456751 [Caerostris extrusa]
MRVYWEDNVPPRQKYSVSFVPPTAALASTVVTLELTVSMYSRTVNHSNNISSDAPNIDLASTGELNELILLQLIQMFKRREKKITIFFHTIIFPPSQRRYTNHETAAASPGALTIRELGENK